MSADSNLQEMENAVTKGAAPAEPMQAGGVPYEDLGGPTPENSRPAHKDKAISFKPVVQDIEPPPCWLL